MDYFNISSKTLSENVKTTLKLGPTFRRQKYNCYVYLASIPLTIIKLYV